MKSRIKAKVKKIVTGVILELSNDDATHLSYFMRTATDGRYPTIQGRKYINSWPWAKNFVEELDKTRGNGHIGGRRTK